MTFKYIETNKSAVGEYSGTLSFGLQAGFNLGKYAALELKALSLTLSETKLNSLEGYSNYQHDDSNPRLSSGINMYFLMTGGGVDFNSKRRDENLDRQIDYSASILGLTRTRMNTLKNYGVKKDFKGIDFGIGAKLFLGIEAKMKSGVETTKEFKKVNY